MKYEQTKELLSNRLKTYNLEHCQCAYPRFQQIIEIDCLQLGGTFKCWETELLINLSKQYFDIEKSKLTDEIENKLWTCKKCKSTYEYGYTDFSKNIERQKLKLLNLTVKEIGEPIIIPIPLYLGLLSDSFPDKLEMIKVDVKGFQNYITEIN